MCKNTVTLEHWKKKNCNEPYEEEIQQTNTLLRTQIPRKAALKAYMLKFNVKSTNKTKKKKKTKQNKKKTRTILKYFTKEINTKQIQHKIETCQVKIQHEKEKRAMCKRKKEKSLFLKEIKELKIQKRKLNKQILKKMIIIDNLFFYKMTRYKFHFPLNKRTSLLEFGEENILDLIFKSCRESVWHLLRKTCKLLLYMFIKEWRNRKLLPSCLARFLALDS